MIFELRTYSAHEGKLEALLKRFRDHTLRMFEKHGITSIGYWVSEQGTLIYILSHPSRETAKSNWDAFRADPEWKKIAAESEANGKLVRRIDSVFMEATDFSAIR